MNFKKYDFVREIYDGVYYCNMEDHEDDVIKLTHFVVTDTQEVRVGHSPYSIPEMTEVLRVAKLNGMPNYAKNRKPFYVGCCSG